MIELYTDGSATTADKPGGWGYVIVVNGIKISEGSGHMVSATNNDAEMEAAIQGLRAVYDLTLPEMKDDVYCAGKEGNQKIVVVSDSRLILGWIDGIYRFKQQDKIAKYKELQLLSKTMGVKTRWVEGHKGHEHNERCDKLANAARLKIQSALEREVRKELGQTLIGEKKSGTVCVWYKGVLKIIDLDINTVENYNREIHGARGSMLEIKEDRYREHKEQ